MKNQAYYDHAEQAAELEKKQQYRDAALHWQLASGKAKKEINCEYATERSKFCNRMAVRPFSRGEE